MLIMLFLILINHDLSVGCVGSIQKKLVSLSTSSCAWEDSSCVDAMGRDTLIGANGWNNLKSIMDNRVVKGYIVSMLGRFPSHPHRFLHLYNHRICIIITLTTSVFPSIWGWKEIDLVSLVSIIDHRMDQKVHKNMLSLYEIMVYSIPT